MATNLSRIGSELQVNIAPNQDGDQLDPDVAALTSGRFFTVFTDEGATGGDNIIGQFVSIDGTRLEEHRIEADLDFQYDPAVAQRANGAAVVVWTDDGASEEIHYAIVSSAGTVGTEQTILDGNDLDNADVATLADGRSLVVAEQFNTTTDDIVFRFIDANGAPDAALQAFIDNGAGDQISPSAAAFGNNALVVYEDTNGTTSQVQARFFNGTSFAAEVTIVTLPDYDSDDDGDTALPDVAALTDGRFIVVWKNEQVDRIEGRFVSATGTPLGNVFTISGSYSEDPKVSALPDGGFIVAWDDYSGLAPEIDGNDTAIHARRFTANGDPAGDEILVNTGDPDTDQYDPGIATDLASGRTFIAWTDEHSFTGTGEDAEPDSVRGRVLELTNDDVNGSAGDDQIATYNIDEKIFGLAGDDLINGFGGNDTISGGTGFDHIKGGAGNDQLLGEGGEDLLKGEDGDDLLVGGVGRDVQLGGSGKDTFDFNKVSESRVGAKHDLIQGFKHSEGDRIDLKNIDADTTAGGNQAFDLIGAAAFSGTAGELRFAGGLLQGDVNGDGVVDFEVKVTGLGGAVDGDFVL